MMVKEIQIIRKFEGVIRFRSESLFRFNSYKELLADVAVIKGVEGVDSSPVTKTIRVLYNSAQIKEKTLLSNLTRILNTVKKSSRQKPLAEVRSLRRYGHTVSGWQVRSSSLGRLRVSHPSLYRRKACLEYLEERLLDTPGIEKVTGNLNTQSILVYYQEQKINQERILAISQISLSEALVKFKNKDKQNLHRPLTVTSLGLAAAGDYFFPWMIPMNAALICYTGKPTFDKVKKNLWKKKFGLEILDAFVTVSCLATGQIFAAALMVFLVGMGRNMLNKPSDDSKKLLSRLIYKIPRFAWLIKGKKEIEVSVKSLKPGDRIVLGAGEIIPIDGVIYSGNAVIDESNLTGQINPVKKKKLNKVFSSTKIISGKIYVKVNKSVAESIATKIKDIVFNTSNHKIRAHCIGEKVQEHAVLPTIGASFLSYGMGGFDSAMAVVTADYGTGIKTTTPMGFLSTLGLAVKQGVFIKDGAAFEKLAGVDAVIFKNENNFKDREWEVRNILKFNGLTKEEILGFAAVGTSLFYNPLTKALMNKVKEMNLKNPGIYRYSGDTLTVNGENLVVGNDVLLKSRDIEIPSSVKDRLFCLRALKEDLLFIALEGKLAGAIEVGSSERLLTVDIIENLKRRGVEEIAFASSERNKDTQRLADSLGINYFANISPKEESGIVNRLHKDDRKVAIISDSSNLYPSRPDVSIALSEFSNIGDNNAHIILRKGDFLKLPAVFDISKNFRRNTRRTVGLIAIPNTLCICGAMFGVIGFAQTMILNCGCNFIATLSNSIPLYRTYEDELQQEYTEKKLLAK